MSDYLPLKALKAFEVTARLGSVKKAAEELHVTTGAVSQQIKMLEDIIGVKLFHRLRQGLELTEAAKAGIPELTTGFAYLSKAIQHIQEGDNQVSLKVWSAPSFADKWLLSHLPNFMAEHSSIDLSIFASEIMIGNRGNSEMIPSKAFYKKDIDIGIFFGSGDFKDYRADKLFSVDVVPLCSPELVNHPTHPLRTPEDLNFHTLIHDDTALEGRPDWNGWLRYIGVDTLNTIHSIHFNQMALALNAAISGQGVVLGVKQLAEKELADGRLVIPFGPQLPLDFAYYLVSLQDTQDEPKIRVFREWMLGLV